MPVASVPPDFSHLVGERLKELKSVAQIDWSTTPLLGFLSPVLKNEKFGPSFGISQVQASFLDRGAHFAKLLLN